MAGPAAGTPYTRGMRAAALALLFVGLLDREAEACSCVMSDDTLRAACWAYERSAVVFSGRVIASIPMEGRAWDGRYLPTDERGRFSEPVFLAQRYRVVADLEEPGPARRRLAGRPVDVRIAGATQRVRLVIGK